MTKLLLKSLWGVVFILFPILLVNLYFDGSWYSLFHSYSLGIFFGLISYALLCVSLITASRIPILEKLFGQDKLIATHGVFALLAIVAGALHTIFKLQFGVFIEAQLILGILGFALIAAVSALTLIFMTPIPLPFIKKIKRWGGEGHLRYTVAKRVHNLLSLAFLLILLHVVFAAATAEQDIRVALILISGVVTVLSYIYHRAIRPLLSKKGVVDSIKEINNDLFEVTIKLEKPLHTKPGQFGYIRFLKSPLGGEEHPFTFASTPPHKELILLIKKEGIYTNALSKTATKTPVRVDGPYGTFSMSDITAPLLAVAGGVGITPFISHIRYWAKNPECRPSSRVTLIWSCKRRDDMPYYDEIRDLSNEWEGLKFIPIFTRENDGKRLTPDNIREEIELLGRDCHLLYCAGGSMGSTIVRGARMAKLKKRRVHSEKFLS